MNFERTGDVKETLKIGRKANAYKVISFEVKGKLALPIDKTKLTEKIIEKYKLDSTSAAVVVTTTFGIADEAFEHALEILTIDGISLVLIWCP
jgi:hypothetical protein